MRLASASLAAARLEAASWPAEGQYPYFSAVGESREPRTRQERNDGDDFDPNVMPHLTFGW